MTPSTALAGISHGTSSPEGQAAVAALMSAVAQTLPDIEVAAGFVDVQHPDTEETLNSLPPGVSATIVPLLLSAGYHVHVDLTDSVRAQSERTVTLGGALGPDERLTELLLQRLREAGLKDDDTLVLAVAGSSDARAVVDCRAVAASLAAASGHQVTLGFLSAAQPRLRDAVASARAAAPGRRVMVSSYLLAPGYFQDLAVAAGGDVTTEPLLLARGPAPQQLVDVVIDRYRSCTSCTTCGGFCQRGT
ncbi:MAG: sirohydrochlorin chelatase [Rhodoglobus sp.]